MMSLPDRDFVAYILRQRWTRRGAKGPTHSKTRVDTSARMVDDIYTAIVQADEELNPRPYYWGGEASIDRRCQISIKDMAILLGMPVPYVRALIRDRRAPWDWDRRHKPDGEVLKRMFNVMNTKIARRKHIEDMNEQNRERRTEGG